MASLSIILYKLSNALNHASAAVGGIEHTITVGAQGSKISISDCEYSFTVAHFILENKVYSPAKLSFQLNVTDIKKSDTKEDVSSSYSHCRRLADFLSGHSLKLRKINPGQNSQDDKVQYVCDNFYIYDVTPEFSKKKNSATIRLLITAYSADHKLTLKKFNRAYTCRKFKEVVAADLGSGGTLAKLGVEFHAKYLQFIAGYTKKPSSTVTESYTETEILQPYMVQYDESYYNFLARTANRCGEFLYFENGMLNLGLDKPLFSKLDVIDYDADDKKNLISGISFRKLNTIENPEPYYPDVMKQSGAKANFSETNYVQDAKVGNDEFLYTMEKGKWVDMWKDYYLPAWPAKLTSILSELLNNQTIGEAIAKLMVTESIEMGSAATVAKSVNDSLDKEFWNKYAKDKDDKIFDDTEAYMFTSNEDQWNQNLTNVDANFDKKLSLKFYHALFNYEQEVSAEAVTINTGVYCDTDIRLGKIVQFDGKRYVVVAINGRYSQGQGGSDSSGSNSQDGSDSSGRSVEDYSFTAIPVKEFNKTIDLKKDADNAKAESIQAYLVVPPLYEGGHVCHSAMQRAYVVTNNDPQFLSRVQIKYPWQTDAETDDPSPFIRMAKDFVGEDFGITFMPDKETEVLVDYEGGNVERPFVVGSLHNQVSKPQPENRSIKSRNGHKIVFDDPADGSKMFWEMFGGACTLLTQTFPVPGWGPLHTKADAIKELSGGIEMCDEYGFYKIAMSTDKRAISIDSPFGTVDVNAFTGISINAPNGDIRLNGKNIVISASNELLIESGTQIDEKLGGASFHIGSGFKQALVNGATAVLSEILSLVVPDIPLLRTVYESFIKPCNGTLRIKSYRYLMLEAGLNGFAQIPKSAYINGRAPKPIKYADRILHYKGQPIRDIINAFNNNKAKSIVLIAAYNAVADKRNQLKATVMANGDAVDVPQGSSLKSQADAIVQNALSAQADPNNIPHLKAQVPAGGANQTKINDARTEIISAFTAAADAFKAFSRKKDNKNDQGNALAQGQETNPELIAGNPNSRLWNYVKPHKEDFTRTLSTFVDGVTDDAKKSIIKKVIDQINAGLDGLCSWKLKYSNTAATPAELIESIDWNKSFTRTFVDVGKDAIFDNSIIELIAKFIKDPSLFRPWTEESHDKGQILFSDSNAHYGQTIPLSSITYAQANPTDTITTLPALKQSLQQIYL